MRRSFKLPFLWPEPYHRTGGDVKFFLLDEKPAVVPVGVPIDNETRRMIEEKVFAAYKLFVNEPLNRSARE